MSSDAANIATLFDDVRRSDSAHAHDDEDTWTFLRRVDSVGGDRLRRAMNAWFARLPMSDRAHVRGRMTSGSDIDFHAAWFELYLHELHRQLGFDVAVEPDLAGAPTNPDFLITGGRDAFYLEATVVGNRREEPRSRRRAAVTAAINRIDSPDFSLQFEIETESVEAPSMRKVRARVEQWLDGLDWERERATQETGFDLDALPTRVDRAGDWSFVFRSWPRRPEDRGRRGAGAIDIYPSDGGTFDHPAALRRRLEEKAAKYGTPPHPVVLAVRFDHLGADSDDVRVALFGPSIGRMDAQCPSRVVDTGRHGAGLFRDGSGQWRNRHVAGVLVWDLELRPWSVARRRPLLWLHPQPFAPLTVDLPWSVMVSDAAGHRVREGVFDPARVPELPGIDEFDDASEWPGELFSD